jgi:hypothetical protein
MSIFGRTRRSLQHEVVDAKIMTKDFHNKVECPTFPNFATIRAEFALQDARDETFMQVFISSWLLPFMKVIIRNLVEARHPRSTCRD